MHKCSHTSKHTHTHIRTYSIRTDSIYIWYYINDEIHNLSLNKEKGQQ